MGEKLKDNWIIVLFQTGVTVIIVFLGFYLNSSELEAKNIQEDIDSRATKKEFYELKAKNIEDHDKFVSKDQFEEFKDGLNTILDYIKSQKGN